MKKYFVLLCFISLLFGCSTTQSLSQNNKERQAIAARFTTHIQLGNKINETAGGSLRMLRDSVVQISLAKFGIEGVRLVFTPDSMLILDKINKRYYHNSYNNAQGLLLGAEGLNFAQIQAFFWNDANKTHEEGSTRALGFVPIKAKVQREGKNTTLHGHEIYEQLQLNVEVQNINSDLQFKFSKIRKNDDWEILKHVPASYKAITNEELLKKLLSVGNNKNLFSEQQ